MPPVSSDPTAGALILASWGVAVRDDILDITNGHDHSGAADTGKLLHANSLNGIVTTQGDILYRNATGLARLGTGTAAQVLQAGGAGANPSWTGAKWPAIVDQGLYTMLDFDSLDGYIIDLVGAGSSVSISTSGYVILTTDTNLSDYASVGRYIAYPLVTPSWAKARRFRVKVVIMQKTNQTITINTGALGALAGFGFLIDDDVIKGTAGDGAVMASVNLETLTGGGAWTRLLEADFSPGNYVKFYVDGTYIDQVTTNLPTGTTWATLFFYTRAVTDFAGESKILRLSQVEIYQAP